MIFDYRKKNNNNNRPTSRQWHLWRIRGKVPTRVDSATRVCLNRDNAFM